MKYVNVVIDNASDHTDRLYTYGCSVDDVRPGDKVLVPFGPSDRLRGAWVFEIFATAPAEMKNLKYVRDFDPGQSLTETDIEICRWMRRRYCCRYYDALTCFIQNGRPLKSGKKRKPEPEEIPADNPVRLTKEQEEALERICPFLNQSRHRTFLVHGVTGSGKTEIYLRVAGDCLARGKTVIMLVPEISLTPQTVQRFMARFGRERIAVLHSRLSAGERFDEWTRIRSGEADIVIGARSAVFAPLKDIGAIILDEEHEGSYKSDKSPKYDAAEVAIRRARLAGGVVILGSATPSLVSTWRTDTRLYEKLTLQNRYNRNVLPKICLVDMRDELRQGNKTIFSSALYEEMQQCLSAGKQVILFLNRRGYSTFISCRNCGYVMRCPECGISMTYHKLERRTICHLCGRTQPVPTRCPECDTRYLKHFGTGTEKVEELTGELFPDVPSDRLDLDAARRKGSVERILNRFGKGKTKILIGTQMVAKGLDFSGVGLVGIVSADVTLNIPDFRAAERTFQLITQAAGRAGRGGEQGKVVIQTYRPDHYAVRFAADHDYRRFYETELLIRKAMDYPPVADLVQVTVSAADEPRAAGGAATLFERLQQRLPKDRRTVLLGPVSAAGRTQEQYRCLICLKVFPEHRIRTEQILMEEKLRINTEKKSSCHIGIDVNPSSFL